MQETDRPLEIRALLDGGCVALNLRRAARVVTRRYEEALRPVNLTSFQFSALNALADQGPQAQSALAAAFGMDVSTLSRNIRPLAARGLVRATAGTADRRVKTLSVTDDGRALFEAALPLWAGAQRRTIAEFGDRVWPMLRATLDNIEA